MVWKQQGEACPLRLKGVRCEPRAAWEEAVSQEPEGPCGAQKTGGHGGEGSVPGPPSDGGGTEHGERGGLVLVTQSRQVYRMAGVVGWGRPCPSNGNVTRMRDDSACTC